MKKMGLLILVTLMFFLVACQSEPEDVVPPSIIGAKDFTYTIGKTKPDFLEGVTANDNIDGDITYLIEADTSEVDFTSPGIYNITYTVSDLSNNTSKEEVIIIVLEAFKP
ncbi:MAG: DUF5011 domain-containing protein [Acholeplasmataceae bacterium]|jgi:hypothetical protein|nr:DUF5011 domain-containing protein [Acholeplasmataceae bacterium]